MVITVNGDIMELDDAATVAELMERLALNVPYAVELNRKVCPKKRHTETALQDGDIVEIVTAVGGG